jgi:hypothetical protein
MGCRECQRELIMEAGTFSSFVIRYSLFLRPWLDRATPGA